MSVSPSSFYLNCKTNLKKNALDYDHIFPSSPIICPFHYIHYGSSPSSDSLSSNSSPSSISRVLFTHSGGDSESRIHTHIVHVPEQPFGAYDGTLGREVNMIRRYICMGLEGRGTKA
jgi:hypothetical protein